MDVPQLAYRWVSMAVVLCWAAQGPGVEPASSPAEPLPAAVQSAAVAPGEPLQFASESVESASPYPLAEAAGPVYCANFSDIPNMLGDFIGGWYFGPPLPSATARPRAIARTLPRYKVADNNSPIPRTRLLYSYNYFNNAFDTSGDVHRHFLGGELLLGSGRFSVESRISLNEFHGFPTGVNEAEVGDLRTTVKVPVYESEVSLASVGLAIGWPVGDMPGALSDSNVIFAPFVGYVLAPPERRWFLQGFGQLDIPTEVDDVLLFHSDVGVGYFVRRQASSRLISSIVPTAELHLYSPIDDAAGVYEALDYEHVLNGTVGATIVLGRNLSLASGVSFPLTDNQHYDVEFQFHLSWRLGGGR